MQTKHTSKRFLRFEILTIAFFSLFLVFTGLTMVIANPPIHTQTVFKDWTMLKENSETVVDVFYRVVECDTANFVELKVFNENSKDQTVEFDINIKNKISSTNFKKTIKLVDVKKGAIIVSSCTAGKSDNLAIPLPVNYNPNNLVLTITFK